MKLLLLRRLAASAALGCLCAALDARPDERSRERWRPQFHFTPAKNWMNDPNGMVFYDGEYHLFYQFNPYGDKWGHMSWGHAVSRDLVRWEHLPVALYEENNVMIFSGSAVVDWKNTSGFGKDGKPPLVAIYTGHSTNKPLQNQQIAYSNDRGRTWTKYSGNPVLDIGDKDFRDPKVFWHEPTGRWVMVVSWPVHRKLRFYASSNLKQWAHLSDFGPAGATTGIWECPDLFPVKVENREGLQKWVLIVNVGSGAPAGGSGCQYFVGEFDGTTFVPDKLPSAPGDAAAPQGTVLADFEGADFGDWRATGTSFAAGPVQGGPPLTGFRGRGLLNSWGGGDPEQGTLTSPPFSIETNHVNFLIGGGDHPGETGIQLIVDGKTVRAATGNNSARLEWKSWDVRDLKGKRAQLQIMDRAAGAWGHIYVDHIMLADTPARSTAEVANWVDYARDFYAAVSWSDVPKRDGRRLWLGWMSNWEYANEVPTSPWRGAMSIPRALSLEQTENSWLLLQRPVKEMETLRRQRIELVLENLTGQADLSKLNGVTPDLFEVEADLEPSADALFQLELRTGETEETVLRGDVPSRSLILDRTRSGSVGFHKQFPSTARAPLRLINGRVKLRLFVDTSSVEVFVNDGETVQTSVILPSAGNRRLDLTVVQGELRRANLSVWKLASAWSE